MLVLIRATIWLVRSWLPTMHICMASGFTLTVSRLLHFSIFASAGGPQGFKLELFRPT